MTNTEQQRYTPDEFAAFELGAQVALDYAMALALLEPKLKGREFAERLLEYRNRAFQLPKELRDLKFPKP